MAMRDDARRGRWREGEGTWTKGQLPCAEVTLVRNDVAHTGLVSGPNHREGIPVECLRPLLEFEAPTTAAVLGRARADNSRSAAMYEHTHLGDPRELEVRRGGREGMRPLERPAWRGGSGTVVHRLPTVAMTKERMSRRSRRDMR